MDLHLTNISQEYYKQKFPHELNQEAVTRKYLEGLLWVLHYYYQGVRSWSWYYPYFFAPLPSRMTNLTQIAEAVWIPKYY